MSDSQLVSDLSLFESLSKILAIALGLLYLFGFLVVAAYLSRYGVSSFAVLQLQYLVAGIWALGPLVLHMVIDEVERRFGERAAPEVKGKFNWRRVVVSLFSSMIPSGFFIAILVAIPNLVDNLTWRIGVRVLLFYFGIWISGQLFWASRRVSADRETWLRTRDHAAHFFLVTLLMTVLGNALWFGARVYPLIPFSLGGGRPLTVVFFEGEKKMPEEIRRSSESAKRSVPYRLLLATDKYYVVLSPSDKERSLEISRESVGGIVVLGSN